MTEPRAIYAPDAPIVLTFDWPTDTSLNSRMHWAKRSKANNWAYSEGFYAAAGVHPNILTAGYYETKLVFFPPDQRKRDLDNMLARIKKHLDGMCQAWGIDDSAIRRVTLEWGEVVKGGKVVVTISRL